MASVNAFLERVYTQPPHVHVRTLMLFPLSHTHIHSPTHTHAGPRNAHATRERPAGLCCCHPASQHSNSPTAALALQPTAPAIAAAITAADAATHALLLRSPQPRAVPGHQHRWGPPVHVRYVHTQDYKHACCSSYRHHTRWCQVAGRKGCRCCRYRSDEVEHFGEVCAEGGQAGRQHGAAGGGYTQGAGWGRGGRQRQREQHLSYAHMHACELRRNSFGEIVCAPGGPDGGRRSAGTTAMACRLCTCKGGGGELYECGSCWVPFGGHENLLRWGCCCRMGATVEFD
eukprot:scaffold7231_cov21-Tisochrysis_lutea.AAC.1